MIAPRTTTYIIYASCSTIQISSIQPSWHAPSCALLHLYLTPPFSLSLFHSIPSLSIDMVSELPYYWSSSSLSSSRSIAWKYSQSHPPWSVRGQLNTTTKNNLRIIGALAKTAKSDLLDFSLPVPQKLYMKDECIANCVWRRAAAHNLMIYMACAMCAHLVDGWVRSVYVNMIFSDSAERKLIMFCLELIPDWSM